MRPVKIVWSNTFTSVFIDSSNFSELVDYIFESLKRDPLPYQFRENSSSEVYDFWTEYGEKFLDAVEKCNLNKVVVLCSKEDRPGVKQLLKNMKALAPKWKKEDLGADGSFELWLDMA